MDELGVRQADRSRHGGGREDLMPLLGIGRNTAYELIRSGQIRSVRIGRQIRIPREALLEFLRK